MTQLDELWNALAARIESDGGVMHRSSFDEVAARFIKEPAPIGLSEFPEPNNVGWDVGVDSSGGRLRALMAAASRKQP